MKMKTKLLCEAEPSSLDIISTLPQPILETILCCLSTKEVAMTSILSREWRYKWTKIPKLEFYHYKRSVSEQTSTMRCKACDDIHQILLLHQGPIHEVTLHIPRYECLEFDQIILHLSSNHIVKKLTLTGSYPKRYKLPKCYKLPMSVFSFHRLTDLNISSLDLDHPPIFNGFDSLGSLYLRDVEASAKTLLHLLSNCPSLKNLIMLVSGSDDKCTINELFECLPMIEHLTTWRYISKSLVLDSVPQKLPTSLIHLKYFCFEEMCFVDGYGLAFLLVLIKCSPNLEKIKLVNDWLHFCDEEYSVVWEDYSNIWLAHLNELEFKYFTNRPREMEFVKFILIRSPKLKKMSILTDIDQDQETEMLKALLQAPRASPVVITVE